MGVRVRPIAVVRRCAHASDCARAGARGTFSGPRSRGTGCGPRRAFPSTPAKLLRSQDTANGASALPPSHLPWPPGGTPAHRLSPRVAAGRWWCPRAQAPFAVSWLSARLDGDDAAVRGGPPMVPRERGPENGGATTALGRSRMWAGPVRTKGIRSKLRATAQSDPSRATFPIRIAQHVLPHLSGGEGVRSWQRRRTQRPARPHVDQGRSTRRSTLPVVPYGPKVSLVST